MEPIVKNIYVVGNLIWISIESNNTYGSKTKQFMLCGRRGGIEPDAILTWDELIERYPTGKFLACINPSDTINFDDK